MWETKYDRLQVFVYFNLDSTGHSAEITRSASRKVMNAESGQTRTHMHDLNRIITRDTKFREVLEHTCLSAEWQ
jgi:ribulose 1,5-bisphosphate synthetase/thiazole synthase